MAVADSDVDSVQRRSSWFFRARPRSKTDDAAARSGMPMLGNAETLAYAAALLVNVVDQMGPQFTAPVIIPYGLWMCASFSTIALFATARGLSAMASNIWMPKLSDVWCRKWTAFLSVVGCAIGYSIQGLAHSFVDDEQDCDANPSITPVIVFMIGRAVTGFFSGMAPVLQAYVTELSRPDMTLVTQRLVVMQVAQQIAGLALSPIAGAVATFGLQLPFFICAGTGVFTMGFVVIFFQEAHVIKGLPPPVIDDEPEEREPHMSLLDVEGGSSIVSTTSRKSPWCDLVVLLLFCSYVCLFVLVVGGSVFLMPVMFRQPSYGIQGEPNSEEFSGNIAKTVGIAGIPIGLCQGFFAIFLFVPVTKRFGEMRTIVFMGIVATCVFPLYGFWATQIWQVMFLNAVIGMCMGFLGPPLGPVAARYASVQYPRQMALVQGIPQVGMQLSVAFSQNMMAVVIGDGSDLRLAWCICAVFCLLFTIIFSITLAMADRRTAMHRMTGEKQKEVLAKTGGASVDDFVRTAEERLRKTLQGREAELWNGEVQFLILQNIEAKVMPKIRPWDDESSGREHLEDLAAHLQLYPERGTRFRRSFPHIAINPELLKGTPKFPMRSPLIGLANPQ